MGPRRRIGRWAAVGALAGYFVPFLWLLFLVLRQGDLSGASDMAPTLFLLFFVVYTATGLCIVGIAFGVGCGLACAWLPKRLWLWQRQAIFTTLILLTGPVCYYMTPLWPFMPHMAL